MERKFQNYTKKFPELAKLITNAQAGKLSVDVEKLLPKFPADPMATRQASGKTLDVLMPQSAVSARRLGRPHAFK